MPTYEEIGSWAASYEVHDHVATCCMIGLLDSLTALPDRTDGPWHAEFTVLDEREDAGEDATDEAAALCRRIVETFPWLKPHILQWAAKIQGDAELDADAALCDGAISIKAVLDEIGTNLLGRQDVRALELLMNPQPAGLDFLLRLTSWNGPVLRIGLRTTFEQDEQDAFDTRLASGESARHFDKKLWFGDLS